MMRKGTTAAVAKHRQEDPRLLAPKEIALEIFDRKTKKKYLRGKFLGKGGFARCYELQDKETNHVYAGKIVPKSMLTKPHQKEKMAMEIEIHRKLNHRHVVGFHSFFEDDDFIYILLEICRRRSLMELHKRRKALTEPEVRYYVNQILIGCIYLHDQKIIHRDLKLGNLFLGDDMDIKIGDFGLATTVQSEKERKRTLCGTPNYIAPEVLSKKGHSFEVDVWSLGCIMYTLLVGKPPFETSSLKETYSRIKRNEYYIPSKVGPVAQKLIVKMLRPEPMNRPTMQEIIQDEFFTSGYLPSCLPPSSLSMAPRFQTTSAPAVETKAATLATKDVKSTEVQNGGGSRRPLFELNRMQTGVSKPKPVENKRRSHAMHVINGESRLMTCEEARKHGLREEEDEAPKDCYLSDLHKQLTSCMATKPSEVSCARPVIQQDDAEDPACNPIFWISKWVDYSDRYGLGYQLCDGTVAVLFNDNTRLILKEDGENLQYIKRDGQEEPCGTLTNYLEQFKKKVTLLQYFQSYMSEHLLKAGGPRGTGREANDFSRLPYLRTWFRTSSAIVLHLSNGVLQINFFRDHTKVIICPCMAAITYIDEKRNARTFPFKSVEKHGCCPELSSRMKYGLAMVERLRDMLPK